MKLRDFINFDGNDEVHTFMKPGKGGKITGQMKYDAFVKHALTTVNPVMKSYLDKQKHAMEACGTVEQLSDLVIPALTPEMKELIVSIVEKQKHLDIVEQTYLLLDLWRAVSGRIGENINKMALHYANAIKSGAWIIRPNGHSFGL